jgi:hypothetical protein
VWKAATLAGTARAESRQEYSDEEIEAVTGERVCLKRKSTAYKRKMRVWERNRSHTRIDVPRGLFQCPQKNETFFFTCFYVFIYS